MSGLDKHTLDCCWIAINACGGVPANERERFQCEGIGEALETIERLGGMDPQERRRLNDAASVELEARLSGLLQYQYGRPAMARAS